MPAHACLRLCVSVSISVSVCVFAFASASACLRACAGGTSFSELRAAYELTKAYDREVIIGSSELFTPARYLELLGSLSESSV